MRGFIFFIVLIAMLGFWFKGFVQSGGLERYLDTHPNASLNPKVEYYWGMLLDFADHKQSALYRLDRVVEKYPKSEYAPIAWAEYIGMLSDKGEKQKAIEESKKFLAGDYATHPKAEIIKKKLEFLEHG